MASSGFSISSRRSLPTLASQLLNGSALGLGMDWIRRKMPYPGLQLFSSDQTAQQRLHHCGNASASSRKAQRTGQQRGRVRFGARSARCNVQHKFRRVL